MFEKPENAEATNAAARAAEAAPVTIDPLSLSEAAAKAPIAAIPYIPPKIESTTGQPLLVEHVK